MKQTKQIILIYISALFWLGSAFAAEVPQSITAILGAFDEEVIMLQQKLTEKSERQIEGMKFVIGHLKGRKVVIAWTGIGKVNAAMTTTLLIEHFRPNEVIFTGIAGRINPQLSVGDIVIAEKTAQHDYGLLTTSGMENKGPPNPITRTRNPVFLPADKRLLQLAEKAAKQIEFEKIETINGTKSPRVTKGIIVTGDIFVASGAKCAELRKRLSADAVEMEGAAVAQICYQQAVPCIIIRSLSDNADEKAVEDMDKFYKVAAGNSATLVANMIEQLSPRISVEVSHEHH